MDMINDNQHPHACTMSRRESKVDISGYIDTQFSSGDANRHPKYQEENNNEVDELSKELSEMGCIVGAVKRPPNICVETCVYNSESEDENAKGDNDNDKDNKDKDKEEVYSDEFEEDNSDAEESVRTQPTHKSSESVSKSLSHSSKLSKSRSSMSSRAPGSISGRTNYGSVSVPHTRRVNMSFTNERLREIERHNHILLTKILSARNQRKSSIPPPQEPALRKPVPSAAVMRKKQQRQIDHDNTSEELEKSFHPIATWLGAEETRAIGSRDEKEAAAADRPSQHDLAKENPARQVIVVQLPPLIQRWRSQRGRWPHTQYLFTSSYC